MMRSEMPPFFYEDVHFIADNFVVGNNTAGRLVERRRDFRNGCGAAAGLFVYGTKQYKRSEDQQKGQNADDGFD